MRRIQFYKIFVCSIIMMVHASSSSSSSSTNNYYSKPNDRFEPSKQIFNGRFMPEDSINQQNMNNYNTEHRERDYNFGGKINQANFEVGNIPLTGYSTNNGLPGYIDPSYENYNNNNNFNFVKEQLPYHFGKYSVNNSNQESDFGKYRHFDSSQFSNNEHQHEGFFHTELISGNYPAKVPLSFPSTEYEQDSDTSMIDDIYINNNNDNQQFYGKQRGNNFNFKGNYNYGDDALKIFSSDIFNMQENQKIKDHIQSFNQNHGQQAFDDLSSSLSNNYNSNVQGKDVNFHKPERPINYRGTKYSSIYPSKSNLNYLIKGPKKNYLPNNYAKGNGKAIILKITGSGTHPRYIYSPRLYPNIKNDLNRSYKKKRNNLLNRPRNNKPVPVRSNNNDNDYDDSESSELYNRNSKYTDSLSSNAFVTYS
ncbi:PREDICTED: probable serine/threonine-protein kinase clkA [Polistes dominula]|uniref:Probable serine/threonine-protein kinase clkA n=1 Tax=Polistes dominula TaxID=743375 RepID=A0ABM1IYY8_POLDO|nr:PREDICTED: probable serine/threonine-protein kinase clkA [Polistes dominula]